MEPLTQWGFSSTMDFKRQLVGGRFRTNPPPQSCERPLALLRYSPCPLSQVILTTSFYFHAFHYLYIKLINLQNLVKNWKHWRMLLHAAGKAGYWCRHIYIIDVVFVICMSLMSSYLLTKTGPVWLLKDPFGIQLKPFKTIIIAVFPASAFGFRTWSTTLGLSEMGDFLWRFGLQDYKRLWMDQ